MPVPGLKQIPDDWQRALAIVAHPDDLEFGAASAIAAWTAQGKDIRYLLVTKGEAGIDGMAPEGAGPLREEEERASAAVVGVSSVEFLDHPDGIVEYGVRLRRDLACAIRRHQPEILISINPHATWGDGSWNTPDHRAVGQAVVDGARDAANRWIFRDLLEEGHQPWNGVRFALFNGAPNPTHALDIDGSLDAGIQSLRCHKAYLAALDGHFDPDQFLRSMAENDGKLFGCRHAVSFELVSV